LKLGNLWRLPLLGLLWTIAYLVPDVSRAEPLIPRSILVIDQSDGRGPTYFALYSSFLSTVNASSDSPATVYAEGLDLARFSSPTYEDGLRDLFHAKYRDKPIGVIVAVGAVALEYVLRWKSQLWPGTLVTFTLVDESEFARLKPPPDVVGNIVNRSLSGAMSTARIAVPELKRVAFVGDAWERQTNFRHWKDEIPTAVAPTEIIDLMGLPMRQLLQRVASLPDHTAILFTSMTLDGERAINPPADALLPVAKAANRPIVVSSDVFIGRGGTGGFVASPSKTGTSAARLALRLLDGEIATTIPVASEQVAQPVFDWRQMQRWGISNASLPAGTEVRFRDPSAWETYRMPILAICAALLLQAALIAWLIYEHRRRSFAEAQARQSMAELTYMNRVASAGLLSASLAHEVNQPLTGIVLKAGAALRWLAAETPKTGEVRAALQQIVEAGHRAAEIITNVKAMFSKDDGREKAPVDINMLIRSVLGLVYFDLRKHSVESQISLGEHLPTILGNEVQLRQVVLNLLMNAIEAMSATDRRVLTIASGLSEIGGVRVSVEDTGRGIDPSNADRIFTPLFTTKPSGMGMGLSICHSIIESHGGKLWATPGTSRGSVFKIELPANLDSAMRAATAA
jgi:signal transduction histidine kinase